MDIYQRKIAKWILHPFNIYIYKGDKFTDAHSAKKIPIPPSHNTGTVTNGVLRRSYAESCVTPGPSLIEFGGIRATV